MLKGFFNAIRFFLRDFFNRAKSDVPTTPTQPTTPETPTTPVEPETPTTPEVPEEPTEPETPVEPEPPVEPEEPEVIDGRNASAFTVNTIGTVYVGDNVTLTFSLKGTLGVTQYPIDYADVVLEYTANDMTGIRTKYDLKTQSYGSTNEGTVSLTMSPLKAGEYHAKAIFNGDSLYKGCEISASFVAVEKPVVIDPIPIGEDFSIPSNSYILRMGVNQVTGKLTIGGVDVTSTMEGINDSTLLAYAIDGFLNGNTSVIGKNQVFPKFQGTITCTSVQELFSKYFEYMKKYGLKVLRVGGHDIWGTGLQYNAWKNKHDAFIALLKTMVNEASKAGIYLIPVLGGTQDYPAFTYGGSGDVFNTTSTAYSGFITYCKDIMTTLGPYNGIGLYDVFNEPDHDRMGDKYWKSNGGKTAFNTWANSVATSTKGISTHPRVMGVAGLGTFFSWGQADFNLATGDVALETLDRHFYASANDAYLFADPESWAKAKKKPLIWTEVGYNGIYPEGYWPSAINTLKANGGQMICWMSLNAYPNYPNLTIEPSPPEEPEPPVEPEIPTEPTIPVVNDVNPIGTYGPQKLSETTAYTYKVSLDGGLYVVKDQNDVVKSSNSSAATAINWALSNLSANRTTSQEVYLKGDFSLNASLKPNSYTKILLDGSVSVGSSGYGIYATGKKNIEIAGGKWDGKRGSRKLTSANNTMQFENCSDIVIHDTVVTEGCYDNIECMGCDKVHIYNIESANANWDSLMMAWTNNSVVEGCYIHDIKQGGCYFYTEDDAKAQTINNNVMRNNKVERCLTSGLSLSTRGVEDKTDGGLVEDNVCVDCGQDTDHPCLNIGWGTSRPATNTIVRRNVCYATQSQAETGIAFAGSGCQCYDNIMYDLPGPAIQLGGTNNTITNNKITNCGKGQGYPGINMESCNSSKITGNTIKNCNTAILVTSSSNNTITGNIFSGNSTNIRVSSGSGNVTSPNP